MQNTLELLAKAEKVQDLSAWAQKLGLTKRALYTAKYRGSISPAVAGALAEELGEDAAAWMVIAALEGERDSACKTRMIKKFIAGSALALGTTAALAAPNSGSLCIMSNQYFLLRSRHCLQSPLGVNVLVLQLVNKAIELRFLRPRPSRVSASFCHFR